MVLKKLLLLVFYRGGGLVFCGEDENEEKDVGCRGFLCEVKIILQEEKKRKIHVQTISLDDNNYSLVFLFCLDTKLEFHSCSSRAKLSIPYHQLYSFPN